MPTNGKGVTEVTAPVQLAFTGDRVRLVFISGECCRDYSMQKGMARALFTDGTFLLDEVERKPSNIRRFPGRKT